MIKLFIMDVDGTLTDGKIYMSENGEIMKAFNVKDGYGICNILPKINDDEKDRIVPVIITGRKSKIVERRCEELGIKELYQGISKKIDYVNLLVEKYNIEYENVAYIGDDNNDLECMIVIKENGGTIGCTNDASKEVKEIADFIASKRGGEGSVREFIEYIYNL